MSDAINPDHYKTGDVECIDAIKAALTPEEFAGYCKGNALKYVWREKHKNGAEDLTKASWYLQRLVSVELVGGGNCNNCDAKCTGDDFACSRECVDTLTAEQNQRIDWEAGGLWRDLPKPNDNRDTRPVLEAARRCLVGHPVNPGMKCYLENDHGSFHRSMNGFYRWPQENRESE